MNDKLFFICCGFPKCGTTSIARLFSENSNLNIGFNKESRFLVSSVLSSKTLTGQYGSDLSLIADFTTDYYMDDFEFFSSRLRDISNMGYQVIPVFCFRDPFEQIISHFKHILRENNLSINEVSATGVADLLISKNLYNRLVRGVDYNTFFSLVTDLDFLSKIIVVDFSDLCTLAGQGSVLNLFSSNFHDLKCSEPTILIHDNYEKLIYKYNGIFRQVVDILKRCKVDNFFSMKYKNYFRKILGKKVNSLGVTDEIKEELFSFIPQSSITMNRGSRVISVD